MTITPATDEDATLTKLWANPEITISQIAARFGLSEKGVRYRAERLDLGPKGAGGQWTDVRVARLKELLAAGQSAGQIGADLKITRNAVMGKIHRLKLGRGENAETHRLAGRMSRTHKKDQAAARKAVALRSTPRAPVNFANPGNLRSAGPKAPFTGVKLGKFDPLPGSNPKPWMERGFNECSWPVGDGSGPDLHHCCNAVHKRGWCAQHFAMGTDQGSMKPSVRNALMKALAA